VGSLVNGCGGATDWSASSKAKRPANVNKSGYAIGVTADGEKHLGAAQVERARHPLHLKQLGRRGRAY